MTAMSAFPCPLRVLVVDDHHDTRESFRILVTYWGHDVLTAACGAEALTVGGTYRPHVLLMDFGMPGLNGYETARRLREQPALAGMLLVRVSGFADERNEQDALAAGFDPYLVKPVELDGLEQLLARAATRLLLAAVDGTGVPA